MFVQGARQNDLQRSLEGVAPKNVMASFKSTTTGLDAFQDTAQSLARARPMSVSVGGKATTGSVRRKNGSEDASRSAGENVVILRYWAAHGRDVTFLDSSEIARGREIWMKGIEDIQQGKPGFGVMESTAQKVGELMVASIRSHIQQGRSERGSVKPLKPSTIKRKERETGKTGQPALVRTGQLMESLIVYTRKL